MARVGIICLGGGGPHVAQQLAHIGVGQYVLVDPDVIEETNLNRLVGGTLADVDASLTKIEISDSFSRSESFLSCLCRRIVASMTSNDVAERQRRP